MKKTPNYISEFKNQTIIVVGDIMLDEYVRGEVHRISPEAPVPVVLETGHDMVLGGAGNVAENIAALEGSVTLLGVVGDDEEAKAAKELAKMHGIKTAFVVSEDRPTSVKTRVVAMGHQLLRVDREDNSPIDKKLEQAIVAAIKKLPAHDFVIVSDYNKGIVTKAVMKALKDKFGRKKIVADIKPEKEELYHNIFAITPNLKEAAELTGIYADTNRSADNALRMLSNQFGASVVLTRGEHGISVCEMPKGDVWHLASNPRHVFDVTGAGDTVIATLALMIASGAGLEEAARLANAAGGIVVGKEGTSTVSQQELEEYLSTDARH